MSKRSSKSGESLLSLIEDILDFSKIESGTLTLEDEEIDPRAIVEGIVELLAPRAHAKGIEIVAVLSPDTPALVLADAHAAAPDPHQSRRQCREVHGKGRRAHRCAPGGRPRPAHAALRSARHGRGRSGRKAPADLRRFRAGRFHACATLRRHGFGSRHFQASRGGDGRRDRRRSGAGRRQPLLVHDARDRHPRGQRQSSAGRLEDRAADAQCRAARRPDGGDQSGRRRRRAVRLFGHIRLFAVARRRCGAGRRRPRRRGRASRLALSRNPLDRAADIGRRAASSSNCAPTASPPISSSRCAKPR